MLDKPQKGSLVVLTRRDKDDPDELVVGLTGTVIDECDIAPYIKWDIENDSFNDGNGLSDKNNVYAVTLDQIEYAKTLQRKPSR